LFCGFSKPYHGIKARIITPDTTLSVTKSAVAQAPSSKLPPIETLIAVSTAVTANLSAILNTFFH
jgi:hypothetical protein